MAKTEPATAVFGTRSGGDQSEEASEAGDAASLDASRSHVSGPAPGRERALLDALERAQSIIGTLRDSEERVNQVVELMPACVAFFDTDGVRRFANGRWREWLAGEDGVVPSPAPVSAPAGPAAAAARVVARLLSKVRDGGTARLEENVPCSDGRSRWIAFQGGLHRDFRGRPEGVCLIGIDVTDQHLAQLALRDKEELYALAMRGPNEGLWDWNPITKELFLSARLLSILGFEDNTVRTTSHEWLKLVHPDDRARYQTTVANHLKGRTEHFECEYRVADRNGTFRWMLARGLAVRGIDGVARRMVGSIGDISDLKRREREVRASEARFRALVGVSGNIFLVVDRDGRIVEANREAERVLAGGETDVIGLHWQAVLGEAAAGDFGRQLFAAACGRAVRGYEHPLRRSSDEPRHLLWNIDRFENQGPGGRETLLICAGQDISGRKRAEMAMRDANEVLERRVAERTSALTQEVTERRRAERDLIAAKEVAELANRSKSDFLANMSHELRTPLNAIIGFAEMVRGQMVGPIGNPKYPEYAEVIVQSAHHLLSVINDLLDIAKIESGNFPLDACALIPREAAESSLLLVSERAAAAGLTLASSFPERPTHVRGDVVRVKQILLNLLSNAVKFTDPGGSVRLEVGEPEDGFVTISVGDSGCGMTAAELEVALEPFGQIDSRLTRRAGGTGLGLPLARRFTEMHGGRFDVESAPGVGTTVRVGLPVCAAEEIEASIVLR